MADLRFIRLCRASWPLGLQRAAAGSSSGSMSARDRVRAHWASLEKSAAKRPADVPAEARQTEQAPVHSPFKLVKSVIFDGDARQPELFELADVFSEPALKQLWLFSFGFQIDLFMPLIPDHVDVHIVGQLNTIASETPLTQYKNLTVHRVDIATRWGCHHSKLIFCMYRNGTMRLHVPSFNLSREEMNLAQQMVWSSPMLYESVNDSKSRFQEQLVEYLQTYPAYCSLSALIASIKRFKWRHLDAQNCQFVYSTPFNGGLAQLKQCLIATSEINHGADSDEFPNLFVQVSSMGNPFRKKLDLLQDVMIPYLYTDWFEKDGFDAKLKSKQYTTPFLVHSNLLWPTVQEMETCMTQGLSRGWFFYNRSAATEKKVVPHLRRQAPLRESPTQSEINRHMVPSHTKYYVQYSDERSIQAPDWVLLTSHNLSQSAWGPSPLRKPMNYECGILYSRTLGRNQIHLSLQPALRRRRSHPRDKTHLPTVNILTPYELNFKRYAEHADAPYTSSQP